MNPSHSRGPAPAGSIAPAPPRPRWRVLVVEDHALVRDGIVAVLAPLPEIEVVGVAATSAGARADAAALKPDLVLLDYYLDDADDGATLIRALTAPANPPRVLVLSLHREEEFGETALQAGAAGFVSKSAGAVELRSAIHTVMSGRRYLSERLQALVLGKFLGADETPPRLRGWEKLSERERQVFHLLGAGCATGEIAARLKLSVKTVASHREGLKNKLGCDKGEELVGLAKTWLRGRGAVRS